MKPTNDEIMVRWRDEICKKADEVDPENMYVWEGVWCGFVIGAGRPDLATYEGYQEFGWPQERQYA